MLFNSFSFLGFFGAFAVAYYVAPHRYRWPLLLLASVWLYSTFKPAYVLLLLGVAAVGYAGGRGIDRAPRQAARTAWLAGSVVLVVGALIVNSYTVTTAVGLSFYSFSCISYLVDVFRRDVPAERHVGKLALYLSFFPKLVAGPIERARPFLAQLDRPVSFNAQAVTAGLQLMLWGLVKKVVIADRLAPLVDAAYRLPSFANPADLLLATYFFAFQLYCDFSGYSDLAIGSARVLGFDLAENFRRPYLSTTVREFWAHRWHLSLSSWFRDYVYIPLGGSRASAARSYLNVMVVFLLSGLWHGANWTFVVWGGLNGLYQVVGLVLHRRRAPASVAPGRSTWRRLGGCLVTFHLILLTWVFFRAGSIEDAVTILTRVAASVSLLPRLLSARLQSPEVIISLSLIALLLLVEAFDDVRSMWSRLGTAPVFVRWSVYYAMLLALVLLGNWNLSQFVYMQF